MEFKEFIEEIIQVLYEKLSDKNIDKITSEEIVKNNGVTYTGIIISTKDSKISPTIYMEYYFSRYKEIDNLDRIADMIIDEYLKADRRINKEMYAVCELNDYEHNAIIRLVNYEMNKEMLKDCPYIPFNDLAITFRYLVHRDGNGIASALIRNQELNRWNIDVDTLYEIAKRNTKEQFSIVFKRLDEYFTNDKDFDYEFPENVNLYILTNNIGINGAACILYDDVIEDFANSIDEDLYIIPSSIHEVLIVPVSDSIMKEDLINLVQHVNKWSVISSEVLSNQVYTYSQSNKMITL